MDLPGLVAQYIDKYRLLAPEEKVVVGVSGGADSCCLLFCLHVLGYEVVIGHLNHQLRAESEDDAQFVHNLGKSLGVETFIGSSDIKELAKSGFSIEEAARIARYRFLAEVADNVGTKKLATGHTANDQVETVLMHFLRGAGSSGLRGMLPTTALEDWADLEQAEDLLLIRPLLEVRRSQTEAFCQQKGIETIEDLSNQDVTFFRNRIRHELIPYLREFNPGIEKIILRTAKVMQGEASYLDEALDKSWNLVVVEEEEGIIRFIRDKFERLPRSLKRSFLRRAIKSIDPSIRNLGFDHIEQAMDFLGRATSSRKAQLPSGMEIFQLLDDIVIRKVNEKIYFDQFPQMETVESVGIQFPSTVNLARGWTLNAVKVELDSINRDEFLISEDCRIAAIDTCTLNGSLSLRTPAPGDRFQPFGMDGSVKLSDLFINRKIPKLAREHWPILCDEDGVIWVVGIRISNRVRISSNTSDVVLIRVEPPKEENA